MEFLSISQVQALGCYIEEDQEDQEQLPELPELPELIEEQEEQEEPNEGSGEEVTKDPMEYIDHMFMVSGFVRLSEKESITKNAISRMYSSRTGLCVSLKCGIAYKCCFLYDNKINYI